MNKEILARNLLILDQLKEITEVFKVNNIPVIFLKGSALTQVFQEYAFTRYMDDIDILVKPTDRSKVRTSLNSLNYFAVKEDPGSFCNSSKTACLDVTDHLWYLSKKENECLWLSSKTFELSPLAYYLPPDDFYIHVLAHAAVHHGIKEMTWLKDLEIIKKKWGKEIVPEVLAEKLKTYGLSSVAEVFLDQPEKSSIASHVYLWFLNRSIPLKGHLLRFWFLPFKKKFNYLFDTLYPSTDFLALWYNLTGTFQLFIYRAIRPALLLLKLLFLPFNYFINTIK